MGGAVSSLHRLRNQFLIRLYKKGLVDNTKTIRSLFESVGMKKDDLQVLTKLELKEILGDDSIDILEELFDKCKFEGDCIPLNFIIDFLEKGMFTPATIETVKKQISSITIYPEVWKVLGLMKENEFVTTTATTTSTAMTKYDNGKKQKEKESSKNNNLKGHMMWKKHETVIQERVVKHITIDKEGNMTELITTDKSQNDIIHIESKITGEFAHREYTQQEQTEELDRDISTFVRATEEYIHLKSKEDEYEYLHSEVPPQQTEENTSYDLNDENEYESSQRSCSNDDDILHDTEDGG